MNMPMVNQAVSPNVNTNFNNIKNNTNLTQFALNAEPKEEVAPDSLLMSSNAQNIVADKAAEKKEGQPKIRLASKWINKSESIGAKKDEKVRGITIVLDPGHGGSRPGAVNSRLGLQEKDLNLDICRKLKWLLKKAGWNVVMTRNLDKDLANPEKPLHEDLQKRVDIAEDNDAKLFVSVHNNAHDDKAVNGSAVYYNKPNSKSLAQEIDKSLIEANGRKNEGAREGPYYILKNSEMPAALVECAYMSNPEEAELLSNRKFRQKCAEGIFHGIMNYARNNGLIES